MRFSKASILILAILSLNIFISQAHASKFDIFDGLIKIRTGDDAYQKRHRKHHDSDIVIIPSKSHKKIVVIDEPEVIVYDNAQDWVLLCYETSRKFDWVVVHASNRKVIRRYLRKGYYRAMTGRKKSCKKMGYKKEKYWRRHYKHRHDLFFD